MKTLLTLLAFLVSATILELAGAAAITVGVFLAFGWPAALICAGSMLILKAFEADMRSGDG